MGKSTTTQQPNAITQTGDSRGLGTSEAPQPHLPPPKTDSRGHGASEASKVATRDPLIVDSRGHGTSEAHSWYTAMNLATVPFGLLKLRMSKQSVSDYRKYLKALEKQANCQQRILFLTSCLKNDLIPKFLNFRVPSNGCFDPTTVHNFQRRLLRKK